MQHYVQRDLFANIEKNCLFAVFFNVSLRHIDLRNATLQTCTILNKNWQYLDSVFHWVSALFRPCGDEPHWSHCSRAGKLNDSWNILSSSMTVAISISISRLLRVYPVDPPHLLYLSCSALILEKSIRSHLLYPSILLPSSPFSHIAFLHHSSLFITTRVSCALPHQTHLPTIRHHLKSPVWTWHFQSPFADLTSSMGPVSHKAAH